MGDRSHESPHCHLQVSPVFFQTGHRSLAARWRGLRRRSAAQRMRSAMTDLDIFKEIFRAQADVQRCTAWIECETAGPNGRRLFHITGQDRRAVADAIETRRHYAGERKVTAIGPQRLQDGSFAAMVEIA